MDFIEINEANYQSIASIYQEGINSGMATFETVVPSWEEWNAKYLQFGRIACSENNEIIAWAALSSVSSRKVYSGVAEVSVYVRKKNTNQGIGKMILNQLILESERHNCWSLQASIMPQNKASIAVHRACGFREIGYKEKIALLKDKWMDNILFERRSKLFQ